MNQLIADNKDGKLEYSKTQESEILKNLGNGKILISYSKWHSKPTKSQLGYFFAAIIADHHKHFGYTKDEFYAVLIDECGKIPVVSERTGEVKNVPFSISRRNKMQMMELIDNVIRLLGEQGIHVETPDQYFQRLVETKKPEMSPA